MTLYNLNWGSDLATFAKGLLVGHEGLNRWGLLSFFPILVFGWVWGKDYFSHPKSIFIQRLAFLFLAAGVIIFSLLGFYSERWPPSILYLNWGLAYSFGVLTFWPILKKIKPLVQFGTFAGRHAFAFFVIHTMLVMGVSKIIGYRVYDELSTLILLTTVFIVTSVLILIKEKVETLAFAS